MAISKIISEPFTSYSRIPFPRTLDFSKLLRPFRRGKASSIDVSICVKSSCKFSGPHKQTRIGNKMAMSKVTSKQQWGLDFLEPPMASKIGLRNRG